jgi:hypothetical protein
MNERFGAVHKLWLFASKTGTARLFESKIPRARPLFEPASPVPIVNWIQLAYSRESGDAITHGRHAQTDLVGRDRVVPITNLA